MSDGEQETKQAPPRPVSELSSAEVQEEHARLTALVATLKGADNKKKRNAINARLTALASDMNPGVPAAKTDGGAAAAARKSSGAAAKEAPAVRKSSGAAAQEPAKARKASDAAKPAAKADEKDNRAVLGYWKIRGLAEPIRLMLEYTKTPYVNKYYEQAGPPDYSRESWLKDKADPKLGLDFPNLPYYFEGSLRITQSLAILRHLARKHNLYGDNENDRTIIDMVQGELSDWRPQILEIAYRRNFTDLLENAKTTVIPEFLGRFERFLGDNKFLVGNKLSFVDFLFYEFLDQANIYVPGCFTNYARINKFHAMFRSIPQIRDYLASDRHFARPLNNTSANFR